MNIEQALRLTAGIVVGASLGAPDRAGAQTPAPEELALEAYEAAYFPGDDVQWEVALEITDRRDRVRSREMEVLRRNTGAHEQKYYVYFHEPAAIQRTVFLVWTHGADDDDRWLYLPATDMTQRITGRQKRNSFAGSDFTYEDVTGRHPAQDELELVGEEQVDGRSVWVLRGEPRDPDLVEFGHYLMYIDQETRLPLRGEFHTPDGELHRTLTLEEWERIDGYVTPTRQQAVNHQTGSTTVAVMSEIRYDQGLPEEIFEQRFLQRPPTPYIQPRR